jgi:branched-chain amino acid transport system substrate-binding protein
MNVTMCLRGLKKTGLALLLCSAVVSAAAADSPQPYEINVIVSLTGPAAFLGKEQLQDLNFIEQITNRRGGIKGRPLKFVSLDDGSNPQTALQLASQIKAKNVPVILGPVFTATCNAVAPLVAKAGPVNYCLSPGIHPAAGSYVYSAGVSSDDLAAVMLRYFRARHWTKIAIITSTDATGQDIDRAFDGAKELPENRSVSFVAHEHFNVTDVTVSAQLARIKAANPQAVVAWTSGTAFGTLLRGISDVGLDVPIGGGIANMIYGQLEGYIGFAPRELYFDGFRSLTEGAVGPGPIRDAQAPFFAAFKAAGIRPDAAHAVAWDGIMIVVDALRHLGPTATAAQVQSYITNLHSWAGINAIYDFRDGSQRGTSQNAIVMDRWDPKPNAFVVVSKPAGEPK